MKSEHLKEGQRVMVHMGSAIADIYGTPPFVTTGTVLEQAEDDWWWVSMDIPGPPGMTTLPQRYRAEEILGLSFLAADIPANNEVPGFTTPAEAAPKPHSRACGFAKHDHGSACHSNCPTCGGT